MLKHRIFLVNKYVLGILLDQVLRSISIFVCCHCPLRMIIKSEPMHTPLLSPLIGFGVVLAHKFATSGYGRTFFFINQLPSLGLFHWLNYGKNSFLINFAEHCQIFKKISNKFHELTNGICNILSGKPNFLLHG